jgi:hypothetical protein
MIRLWMSAIRLLTASIPTATTSVLDGISHYRSAHRKND